MAVAAEIRDVGWMWLSQPCGAVGKRREYFERMLNVEGLGETTAGLEGGRVSD